MKTKLVLALLILMTMTIEAQQAAKPKASSFEVASIKRNETQGPVRDIPINSEGSPGRVTMRDVPLRYLLEWAYNLQDYQVSGPSWIISEERYDVVAKAETAATDNEMRPMLQTLLTERLQMTTHRETRDLSVYVLVPGKGPAKVKEPSPDGPQGISLTNSGAALFHKFPMSRLTFLLTRRMDRPVIDLTELKGIYDYSLDLSGLGFNGAPPPDTTGPSIFTAVQNDLGLKLEGRKYPIEILVIDHVEKVPKEP